MIAVTIAPPGTSTSAARLLMVAKSSAPKACQTRNMAIMKPKSPIRFMMKAFLPASALALSPNQKPMSR